MNKDKKINRIRELCRQWELSQLELNRNDIPDTYRKELENLIFEVKDELYRVCKF